MVVRIPPPPPQPVVFNITNEFITNEITNVTNVTEVTNVTNVTNNVTNVTNVTQVVQPRRRRRRRILDPLHNHSLLMRVVHFLLQLIFS